MSPNKDYTSTSLVITTLVIVLLLGVSFIPTINIGGIKLKNVSIISDIISGENGEIPLTGDAYFDTTFLAETEAVRANSTLDSASELASCPDIPVTKSEQWNLYPEVNLDSSYQKSTILPNIDTSHVVHIEDYGVNGGQMSRFYNRLSSKNEGRPTRIAIFGDSFIEGDIVSADIREQLQTLYGGRGVGFLPFDSPYSKFRRTTSQTSTGWHTFSIANLHSTPDSIKNKFFVSGFVSIPEDGATTQMRGVSFRKHINQSSSAKLLFTNQGNSTIHITVNDTLSRVFTPTSSPHPQELNIAVGPINSISTTIQNASGFIGYGIVIQDNTGVSVDNYSIRGNSGSGLLSTNATINSQISKMVGYDLIILQYGLNVMTSDVLEYTSYSQKLERIVAYIHKCFPSSSILIMGIGDRSGKIDGEFVTMPSVKGMIYAQRTAAINSEVAFWNTYEAMGGYNSMVRFVDNRWAAKDYTHISHPGGRYIATQFVKSLMRNVIQYEKTRKKDTANHYVVKPSL